MRKYFLFLLILFLIPITGCDDMMNTPSKRVEEYIAKYQTMDSDVMDDLDEVLDREKDYSDHYKEEYKALLKKQYQNLSYKIKNEQTDGEEAQVEVEIEVFDYQMALDKAKKYIEDHEEEFKEEKDQSREEKIEDYKIKQLKAVTDKIYYTIYFHLTKQNKVWSIDSLDDSDLEKIHGLYKSA